MGFSQLGLSPEVLQAVSDAGYTIPTPIQEQAIPYAGRRGSLVPGSGWGSYSRRRRPPEELQATDQVVKNPSRSCSLFVTITIVVACTLFGFDTENVKHFLGVRYACRTGQISLPRKMAVFRNRASATAILGASCHWWCRAFVFVAEVDPGLGQVVGGHFHGDSIAGKNADAVFLHPAGRIGKSFVPIIELYSEAGVGEQLLHGA